jgi:hypothetical protein
MLEPERRQLLLDALRPPAGYVFDRAVGTTFTLDLVALLVTPVAFALFDVEVDDGRAAANPISVLEAVRRHAGRITVFCQAGQIKVPPAFRAAYAYLESSVVPVRASMPGGIFHPKVWLIRYVGSNEDVRYRFLCLSRNLTFDRSWDTVLRLDGSLSGRSAELSAPLADFVGSLPRLAVAPVASEHAADLELISNEVATVRWEPLPDRLTLERFWPLGNRPGATWPFPDRSWRRLIVAPFASPDFVERFTAPKRGDMIVSRPETLDSIGAPALTHLERRCVLDSDAVGEVDGGPGEDDAEGEPITATLERAELKGLHAKLFVVDDPYWSRIWTGSANATMQAFSRNVEFLVELRGRNTTHGVLSLVTKQPGPTVGFGRLLTDYDPSPTPVEPSAEDETTEALDRLAMSIGAMRFAAEAEPADGDRFMLRLRATGAVDRRDHGAGGPIRLTVRPVSLGATSAIEPTRDPDGFSAGWTVSFVALTAFFVVELTTIGEGAPTSTAFLVKADLSNVPADRLERVLAGEIRSRSDLLRLLLLLLGRYEPAFGDLVDLMTHERVGAPSREDPLLGSEALLEPLLRTLAHNPARLREIETLVSQLTKTDEGRALLPEGWESVWSAISGASEEVTQAR